MCFCIIKAHLQPEGQFKREKLYVNRHNKVSNKRVKC